MKMASMTNIIDELLVIIEKANNYVVQDNYFVMDEFKEQQV